MAHKITCDDLQKLLAKHLQGTVLEPLAERKDYVTTEDNFVDPKVINRLCDVFNQTVRIFEKPNPWRKPGVEQEKAKIRQAMEALKSFTDNPPR